MTKSYGYIIGLIMLVACTKQGITPQKTTIEKESLLGVWSGKNLSQNSPNSLETGNKWCLELKEFKDSVIVYYTDSIPNPSGSKAKGKWSIINGQVIIYWIDNTGYTVMGTLNSQKNRMTGVFYQADDPTQVYNFFLDKVR